MALERLVEDSRSVIGAATDPGVCGIRPSGLVEFEVFGGIEVVDIRLPRDELLDNTEIDALDIGTRVRA